MDGVEALLEAIHDADLEHDGRLRIVTAQWSSLATAHSHKYPLSGPIRLTLRLQLDDGESWSTWRFRFEDVLEYRLSDVFRCGLNISHEDHPAIDQYTQQHEYLHFAGAATDPGRLMSQLQAAHQKLVGDWIPFGRYCRADLSLVASCSGLVAAGPAFIVEKYAEVLAANGCEPIRLARPVAPRAQHASLAHFGESYVIAEEISARRLKS